jgi:hypothetical protein
MAITAALTMFVEDGKIVLKDKTIYDDVESSDYGRAFFIKYDEIVHKAYKNPSHTETIFNYEFLGAYKGYIFVFPYYNSANSYTAGRILVRSLWDNAVTPQDPEPATGDFRKIPRLVIATDSIGEGETPETSENWSFLTDEDAYDDCKADTSAWEATAYIDSKGEIDIVKIDDYRYEVSHGREFMLDIFSLENPGVSLLDEKFQSDGKKYIIDTKVVLKEEDPYDILIVEIQDEVSAYYGIIYEITKLVKVVNHIILMLYCVDNPDEDCRGITMRDEEKKRSQMNSIIALYNSIFWKINSRYSQRVHVSEIQVKDMTITQEIKKEMRRLKIILDNYETTD